jgi:hypothetical protein
VYLLFNKFFSDNYYTSTFQTSFNLSGKQPIKRHLNEVEIVQLEGVWKGFVFLDINWLPIDLFYRNVKKVSLLKNHWCHFIHLSVESADAIIVMDQSGSSSPIIKSIAIQQAPSESVNCYIRHFLYTTNSFVQRH